MTIPASTVPAATLYLHTQLTTQINDTAVLVQYGPPGPNQPDDIVAIGLDIDQESVPYQMVGSGQAGWLDETYTVDITISVFRGGDDPRAAHERAWTLKNAVDQVVRGDPTLGGAVLVSWPSGVSSRQDLEEQHKGRTVMLVQRVTCRARI